MEILNISDISFKRFGIKITLHHARCRSSDNEVLYLRKNLQFDFLTRWMWFFRYKAALYQVEYKDKKVELEFFEYEFTPPIALKIKKAKDNWIGAKRTLTKYRNRLQKATDNWNALFPIESSPRYQNTLEKIEAYECKVNRLENEYLLLKKQLTD